jgi:hypothetical protein
LNCTEESRGASLCVSLPFFLSLYPNPPVYTPYTLKMRDNYFKPQPGPLKDTEINPEMGGGNTGMEGADNAHILMVMNGHRVPPSKSDSPCSSLIHSACCRRPSSSFSTDASIQCLFVRNDHARRDERLAPLWRLQNLGSQKPIIRASSVGLTSSGLTGLSFL